MLTVRRYLPDDLPEVIEVFQQAIRQTASADYTAAQIEAWSQVDPTVWGERCGSRTTWVAVLDEAIAGFIELEDNGHLDMLYVHPRATGAGVATVLLRAAEAHALAVGVQRLYTEASVTARPFFERRNFTVIAPEQVERNGQLFDRFRMAKPLQSAVSERPLAERVRLEAAVTLADDWSVLKKNTFSYLRNDGSWQRQIRETYDRGDGVTILLYDPERRTVVLTRQFRYPAFANGYDDLLIETPAGLLEDASPEARVRAEVEEETGYRVGEVRKVFDAFMSPGSITERVHFFVGTYSPHDRVAEGGGMADEGEDIERLEPTLDEALAMIRDGRIKDAKTIMLLHYAALHLFDDR